MASLLSLSLPYETAPSLVWLRRDLRLDDNLSLASALALEGKIQLLFVFDTEILSRFSSPTDKRLCFIANLLCAIDEKLRNKGGQLLVLHGPAREILPRVAQHLGVRCVFAGKDYEPASKERDRHVQTLLNRQDILFHLQNDHLLVAPEHILKPDHTPYKVFTPFAKKWHQLLSLQTVKLCSPSDQGRYLAALPPLPMPCLDLSRGPAFLLEQIGYIYTSLPEWPIYSPAQLLSEFVQEKLDHYALKKDFLASSHTSRLSPYIRFGALSIRQCYLAAQAHSCSAEWINELIWRDFFATLLHYFPDTQYQAFLPEYRQLSWSGNAVFMDRWRRGLTGFPLVDAAMRQLCQEGWIPNRARMIVASFFTKHLRLDWRHGEEHFAQNLMDYDLASNVGGWQWSASIGADAQPYFRIFNPLLQAKKFDPEGSYIKQYLPELRDLPASMIHAPKRYHPHPNYPDPIVSHAQARLEAIRFFKRG